MMKNILVVIFMLLPTSVIAEVSVIVHPDNENEINADVIKRIFLGKTKSFSSGGKVIPVTATDDKASSRFNKKALKKSSSQIKAYWSKLVFTGKGTPPKELSSGDVLEEVSSNPEVIGYVESSKVTSNVKVVATY